MLIFMPPPYIFPPTEETMSLKRCVRVTRFGYSFF